MNNVVSAKLVSALALTGCAFFPLQSQAQESEIQGAKASVTVALTLTEEVGGFLVKTPKPKSEEEVVPELPYDEILNPRGFDPENLSKADQAKYTEANYYVTKTTAKYRTYDKEFGMDMGIDPTEETTTNSKKLLVSKYGNAQLLIDLVGRGVIPADEGVSPAKAIEGYGIVAVQFLGDAKVHLFAEKKNTAPIFIGGTVEAAEEVSHSLEISAIGGVASLSETKIIKTKYKKEMVEEGFDGEPPVFEWVQDGDSKETYSKSGSGEKDAEFVLRRGDDSAIYVAGLLKYSIIKRNNEEGADIIANMSATLAGSAAESGEGGLSIYGTVSGTIKTGTFKTSTDLSAYGAAIGL